MTNEIFMIEAPVISDITLISVLINLPSPLQGINFDKYEDIPVEATGEDVPDHIDDFKAGDLGEIINENLDLCNYSIPTPVQK